MLHRCWLVHTQDKGDATFHYERAEAALQYAILHHGIRVKMFGQSDGLPNGSPPVTALAVVPPPQVLPENENWVFPHETI